MHSLVTGGAGFIGSHLVRRLLSRGHCVTVLDDFSSGRREHIEEFSDRITLIEGSVTDPRVCARAAHGADFVFHLAAVASVPRSMAAPEQTHAVNVTGTLTLLLACRAAGVRRVVYAASSAAYGNTEVLPSHEGLAPVPLSPYAVSKVAGEQYMAVFSAAYRLETVSLRYFNVFGPGQDPTSQYAAVIPQFVTCALENRAPVIFGDGEQTRDFIFVENVVLANLLAISAPGEACGRVYNVGCGDRISINTLWDRIKAETGATVNPVYQDARPGDVRNSVASLDRVGEALGYCPVISLAEGVRRTISAFRAPAHPRAGFHPPAAFLVGATPDRFAG